MSESPGEVVEQRGLWFEELRTEVVYKHSPGRTIGEADNTQFSTLTMNPQSLHLDAASSASTEFGERLVNSLLTMSVLVGLSVGHLTQGTIVANLGFGDARFPAPVRQNAKGEHHQGSQYCDFYKDRSHGPAPSLRTIRLTTTPIWAARDPFSSVGGRCNRADLRRASYMPRILSAAVRNPSGLSAGCTSAMPAPSNVG